MCLFFSTKNVVDLAGTSEKIADGNHEENVQQQTAGQPV